MNSLSLFLATFLALGAGRASEGFVELGTQVFGHGILEDAGFGPDGSLYVVGRTDPLPEGLPMAPGDPASTYGGSFVAKLSPDGSNVVAVALFPAGSSFLTTVQVNSNGVYVAGYGTSALNGLCQGGLLSTAPDTSLPRVLFTPPEHGDEPRYDPRLGQRGSPVVLRLDQELRGVNAGTFLEGWHSVWHVPKPLNEDRWQPTGLALLDDGRVAVSHDGGYNLPTSGLPGYAEFYQVPDHLSLLDAELQRREWKREVFSPDVAPGKVTGMFSDWPYRTRVGTPPATHRYTAPNPDAWTFPTFGNTRVLRLCTDGRSRLYLAGWSPTRTRAEPWWSPFLFAYDLQGQRVWRVYNPDPMSGPDQRMGNLVSDSAVRSVRLAPNGDLLAALIGDGGNSVLRRDPRDHTRATERLKGTVYGFPGRVLFWGAVVRLDPRDGALLAGNHLGGLTRKQRYSPAWATDLLGLPDGGVLAVGRHREGFSTRAGLTVGPGGFLRWYGVEMDLRRSVSIGLAEPWVLAGREGRVVVAGRNEGMAVVKVFDLTP